MQADFWCLSHLDDAQLLASTQRTLARGRELTAELVAHLSAVEERRLHLHAACSSMFDYCVSRLGLSEDEACRRIDVARLARRFPGVYPLLADGSLSLSVVALLKTHLTEDNHLELLQASRGLSLAKARELLAARAPRADVKSVIRKLPEARRAPEREPTALPLQALTGPAQPLLPTPTSVTPTSAASTSAAPPLASGAPSAPAMLLNRSPSGPPIEPLAPGRYKIQLSASSELKQKLEQCRDLLRHANPSGDFAPIFERALDLLLDKLMRERFGAARRPRIANKTSGGRIDHATRREVTARDGLRCTWTSRDGERCHATGWLELDHEQPFAKGGGSGANNVRVLCRAHNQLAAELEFGRETIHHAISERRRLAREPG